MRTLLRRSLTIIVSASFVEATPSAEQRLERGPHCQNTLHHGQEPDHNANDDGGLVKGAQHSQGLAQGVAVLTAVVQVARVVDVNDLDVLVVLGDVDVVVGPAPVESVGLRGVAVVGQSEGGALGGDGGLEGGLEQGDANTEDHGPADCVPEEPVRPRGAIFSDFMISRKGLATEIDRVELGEKQPEHQAGRGNGLDQESPVKDDGQVGVVSLDLEHVEAKVDQA